MRHYSGERTRVEWLYGIFIQGTRLNDSRNLRSASLNAVGGNECSSYCWQLLIKKIQMPYNDVVRVMITWVDMQLGTIRQYMQVLFICYLVLGSGAEDLKIPPIQNSPPPYLHPNCYTLSLHCIHAYPPSPFQTQLPSSLGVSHSNRLSPPNTQSRSSSVFVLEIPVSWITTCPFVIAAVI